MNIIRFRDQKVSIQWLLSLYYWYYGSTMFSAVPDAPFITTVPSYLDGSSMEFNLLLGLSTTFVLGVSVQYTSADPRGGIYRAHPPTTIGNCDYPMAEVHNQSNSTA